MEKWLSDLLDRMQREVDQDNYLSHLEGSCSKEEVSQVLKEIEKQQGKGKKELEKARSENAVEVLA